MLQTHYAYFLAIARSGRYFLIDVPGAMQPWSIETPDRDYASGFRAFINNEGIRWIVMDARVNVPAESCSTPRMGAETGWEGMTARGAARHCLAMSTFAEEARVTKFGALVVLGL